MEDAVTLLLLIVAGNIVGWALYKLFSRMKEISVPGIGINLLQFSAETLYFALVLCAPLSGNLLVSLIILGILLYALFGGYGEEQLEPLKPEDKVDSKWFPKYP